VTGQARRGDKHLFASRTRFIPPGVLGTFEVCAWPTAKRLASREARGGDVSVDLGARMRGMWSRNG
jgi:DNA helicase-2/ATP-dependent DNA helicase PcrA